MMAKLFAIFLSQIFGQTIYAVGSFSNVTFSNDFVSQDSSLALTHFYLQSLVGYRSRINTALTLPF